MKKLFVLFAIVMIALSCTEEVPEIEIKENKNTLSNRLSTGDSNIEYSQNSLVIQFNDGISDADKDAARTLFEVYSYTPCMSCQDMNLEEWVFEEGVEIEPKKTTIDNNVGGLKSGTGGPILRNVDFQFYFMTESAHSIVKKNTNLNLVPNNIPKRKTINDGVTIAVFDTGIDALLLDQTANNTAVFPDPFLYNASIFANGATTNGMPNLNYGWDFVNDDGDCSDDHPDLHGTAVTSIITKLLDDYNIEYQILPLKVCDETGKASYFDLLCATVFALERAEILHMSLGWYENIQSLPSSNGFNSIFAGLINEHPEAILISSAGNLQNNNDGINGSDYHFPSGYNCRNIIGVASCNETYDGISGFSNYGPTTVDYFANGDNMLFLGNPIQGTSFAAPKVTAMIANIKYNNPPYNGIPASGIFTNFSSGQILSQLFSQGIIAPFNTNNPVLTGKYLVP